MNVAHENTARALRDQPLITKSKLCRFGIHTWEQWSKPYLPKGGEGTGSIQHRYCASCNKAEAIKVSIQGAK